MNIYDTANKLALELKQSEEYVNYKMAKEAINLKADLKEKIKAFEKARYDAQIHAMQNGENDEEKLKIVQDLYVELFEDPEASKFFEAEMKLNVILSDVNKIIGDVIADLMGI